MAANNISVPSTGPPLGNVQTPDFYLRIKQNIDGLQQRLAQVAATAGNQALSQEQLDQIKKALEAGGVDPLNLTGLLGELLQPQKGLIPEVTRLPSIGSSVDGQVVLFRHVIWRFTQKTHTWSVISTIIIQDFEYNLSLYDPALYAPGVIFLSTNTDVTYIEQDIGSPVVATWTPLYSEPVALLHADRFSTGTVNTAGANNNFSVTSATGPAFRPSMLHQRIWIGGNLYPITAYNNTTNVLTVSGNVGANNGSNYYFEYPSVDYPLGALFFETDRTVYYYAGNANGNVAVAGNSVTLLSGFKFDPYWREINIGGNNIGISTVAFNRTALTTSSPAGNNAGIGYSISGGAWIYSTGVYSDIGNNQPTDLDVHTDLGFYFWDQNRTVMVQGSNSNNNLVFGYRWGAYTAAIASVPGNLTTLDAGFLFYASDYLHAYEWSGNAWNFAPGDPGSAYIVAAGGTAPRGGLWAICDGSGVNVATAAAAVSSVTTPDLSNNVFIRGGSPGARQNETTPTWAAGAKTDGSNNLMTDDESAHTHNIQSLLIGVVIGVDFDPGNSNASLSANFGTASAVSANTNNGTPHNHNIVPNPHSHNLSNSNAVLNKPSENNGGLPLRINLAWYMRR